MPGYCIWILGLPLLFILGLTSFFFVGQTDDYTVPNPPITDQSDEPAVEGEDASSEGVSPFQELSTATADSAARATAATIIEDVTASAPFTVTPVPTIMPLTPTTISSFTSTPEPTEPAA